MIENRSQTKVNSLMCDNDDIVNLCVDATNSSYTYMEIFEVYFLEWSGEDSLIWKIIGLIVVHRFRFEVGSTETYILVRSLNKCTRFLRACTTHRQRVCLYVPRIYHITTHKRGYASKLFNTLHVARINYK